MEQQLDSTKSVNFDIDIYGDGDGSNNQLKGYVNSIPVNEIDDDVHDFGGSEVARKLASYIAPKLVFEEVCKGVEDEEEGEDDIGLGYRKRERIIDREDEYKRRRYSREISPDRNDPFVLGDKTPDVLKSTYAEVMKEQILRREKEEILREIVKKKTKEEDEEKNRRSRCDATPAQGRGTDATSSISRTNGWDEIHGRLVVANVADSMATATPASMTWDATPKLAGFATPTPKRQRSRWDETPETTDSATPFLRVSSVYTPRVTPTGGLSLATPTLGAIMRSSLTPNLLRSEKDMEERNCPLADEDLDAILPLEGYRILDPPTSYVPILTPARKLVSTPTPFGTPFYAIPEENRGQQFGIPKEASVNLPFINPEYNQYFGFLTNEEDVEDLSPEEQKRRNIMKLLLKVINGTPPERKTALRRLTDKAREFGAGPLFNCILPLLKLGTLEDQERHQLVKVVDRVVYKLDELVRPYVHKILVQVGTLLVDRDYYARSEGREVISSLCKAVGLATMITAMRPDIDNIDEDVRRRTAKAFSVVASSLGISAVLPFLKAVCQSKKSWQARHTGIWMVQEIAILVGCAVLPHLRHLVEIIEHGLIDVNQKVKKITALAIAALAEASHPYGIEGFDSVLKPLFKGIRSHRGNVLAAFLKATGFMIRLMGIQVSYYAKEVMCVLVRQFQSSDAEMKMIVLKVLKQCMSTEGVEADYIRDDILPIFFQTFWDRRMALDRRNYKQLVETTVEIANKVGAADVVGKIVEDLKSESEHYRKMVMETIENIVVSLGASDINARLEVLLIDGILYAFQEQTSEDADVMLNGFGTVVNSLGQRVKPYLPQISATIKWRLCNKSAKVRQQAADLVSRIAIVMKHCGEEQLMCHLGVVLYESLGEEYPEVLGSILGALKSIVNVIGMTKMTPQIRDLLPCLKPILKNRHEKVQENCIDLVGRIADRGAEFVSAREWMRICF
ncbi:splicing factor 3B subunit, partial [Thalictrum thalictroides]